MADVVKELRTRITLSEPFYSGIDERQYMVYNDMVLKILLVGAVTIFT